MKMKLILALTTLTSASVLANPEPSPYHGYVSTPYSRALLCQLGENSKCDVLQPQSVEGPNGFPTAGPKDGQLASGGGVIPVLDEYGKDRWKKVPMQSGKQTFIWSLTARHPTQNWRFYITKQNWDSSKPLTRSAFDLKPFCSRDDDGELVPVNMVKIDCNVPKRTGYQVILGVWNVDDVNHAFYQAIDADFSSK